MMGCRTRMAAKQGSDVGKFFADTQGFIAVN